MKREILFRGKRVNGKGWVFGYYVEDGKQFIIVNPKNDSYYKVTPSTVGQFTGLTDKNGTKIFEGDQYETDSWPGMVFTIKFVDGSFCGGTEDYGYDPIGYTINQESETIELDNFASTITITSNIHDNPTK